MDEKKFSGMFKKIFENDKIRRAIVIAGVIGIALLFLSSYTDFGASDSDDEQQFSVTAYSSEIESDLQSLISSIEGAGETKVLLTMENSAEYVYLDDSTTKTKEIQPVIRGVLVVCEGGDDPVAVERITNAVTKALDISAAKVCIAKLSE